MAIYLPGTAEELELSLEDLTPREIVAELDKHVVGQRLLALDALHDGAAEAAVERLLAADPGWHEGRSQLAKFRRERGRDDWLALHERAVTAVPRDPGPWRDLIGLQAAADDHAGAAESALRAATATGRVDFMAAAFGMRVAAGEMVAAAALLDDPVVAAHITPLARAKYLLRQRDPSAADALLAPLTEASGDPEAWALRGVAWQALGEPRWEWLHGQAGLVQRRDLGLAEDACAEIVKLLRRLHADAALRIGQSVRGGTQTQGNLFARVEPAVRRLRETMLAAAERYRAGLPLADRHHPLLRHRDAPYRMAASWSVRLTGGGFHVSHIHPKGVISSACHWVVPPTDEEGGAGAGWLELGRPPAYLDLPLPPLAVIEPQPGQLVLFPSTLHHGTRPFAQGERLTIAFDLAPA